MSAHRSGPPTSPLPCLACGRELESMFEGSSRDGYVPYAATMFDAGAGHYGSTVWDQPTGSRSLAINICDECLKLHADRVAVVHAYSPPPVTAFAEWSPNEDDES